MVIIENNEQLDSFFLFKKTYQQKKIVLIPISLMNTNILQIDIICFLLICSSPMRVVMIYPTVQGHSEALNIEVPLYNSDTLRNTHTIKRNKTSYFFTNNVIDVNFLLHYIETNEPLHPKIIDTNAHNFNMKHYPRKKNVNRVFLY